MSLLHLLLSLVLAAGQAAAPTPGPDREPHAAGVLHAWDARRADAWAHGDLAALRALYVRRSAAGRADLAMLRAWRARGLRVVGLHEQLLELRVRAATGSRLVLVVTDRVASAYAVGAGVRIPLPRDAPTTRRLVLLRRAGEWRMAAVAARG
jgi:hypothetical protein